MPSPARCGACLGDVVWGDAPDGSYVPLDRDPTPDGDWVRDRPGPPNVNRVRQLTAGEQPPRGASRFTSHYDTCPKRKP
jgi:hypothetical protein